MNRSQKWLFRMGLAVVIGVLVVQTGCGSDRRRGGGGGGGGGDEEGMASSEDAGLPPERCQLAQAPVGKQVGELVPEITFETHDGQPLLLRDLCGRVIWVQVGTEVT